MTDPIADMLIRIKNGFAASKQTVFVPFSKIKYEIAKIFLREGFILEFGKREKSDGKLIEIKLKYNKDGTPAVSGAKRVSKPGQRIYTESKEIKKVRGGYGMAIVSTSKGLMTNKEARNKNLGGEVICEVW